MAGSAGEVNTYGECNWWRTVQKEGEMASYPQQFHCRELKTLNVHPLNFPALNFTYISSNLIKMLRTVAHHYVINPWPRFVFPNCSWTARLWCFEALRKLTFVILTRAYSSFVRLAKGKWNYSHFCLLPCLLHQSFLPSKQSSSGT